jgi:hypothetical protein
VPKKPRPAPPPEPEEQPAPKLPLPTFPRAPIPGTNLVVRGGSRSQFAEATGDIADPELSDRELVVRFVQRQIEPEQSIEEVRSWSDTKLLEAAELVLSFLPIVRQDDDEHTTVVGALPGDPEAMSILPSFIKIRRKLAERAARQDRRNQQMMAAVNEMAKSGIGNLTLPGADLLKIIGDSTNQAGILKHLVDTGGSNIITGSTTTGLAAALEANNVVGPIRRMMADTEAMKKDLPPGGHGSAVVLPGLVPSIENPQYKVLRAANTTNEILERMHDDQTAFAEDQTEATLGLSKEIAEQTKTIQGVKDSIDKLVISDERQRRAGTRSFWLLVLTVALSFASLLYVSGVLHQFGSSQPQPASTAAPSATSSPNHAATQSPIIPTPSPVAPTTGSSMGKPTA